MKTETVFICHRYMKKKKAMYYIYRYLSFLVCVCVCVTSQSVKHKEKKKKKKILDIIEYESCHHKSIKATSSSVERIYNICMCKAII